MANDMSNIVGMGEEEYAKHLKEQAAKNKRSVEAQKRADAVADSMGSGNATEKGKTVAKVKPKMDGSGEGLGKGKKVLDADNESGGYLGSAVDNIKRRKELFKEFSE